MKTVAIHQPNYLPWLGFFYKIYLADHFVLLDDVPYSRGSFTARTYYRKHRGKGEKGYLSVPLQKAPLGTTINHILIDHAQDWTQRHLNQIRNTYRSSPYFQLYFPLLQDWMKRAQEEKLLADWNVFLIREINQLIGIGTPMLRSGHLRSFGSQTKYLVGLVEELEGNVYLSGTGGRKYQEENLFAKAGISVHYVNSFALLEMMPFPQLQGPWLNGLSIIDAMFNIGGEKIIELFNRLERS